jgi:NAD(P)-dependent dehydrogenase (short-subunit alcohol dehydrogenase family)
MKVIPWKQFGAVERFVGEEHPMLPLMKGRGWGRIINIGSASTFEGVPGQIHYVAAKAGVIGFSPSLARAVGSGGITVNVVTPGLTLTPKAKETLPKELIDQQIQTHAIPRDEKGEDLVGAVFFLASPDADFISGQTNTIIAELVQDWSTPEGSELVKLLVMTAPMMQPVD